LFRCDARATVLARLTAPGVAALRRLRVKWLRILNSGLPGVVHTLNCAVVYTAVGLCARVVLSFRSPADPAWAVNFDSPERIMVSHVVKPFSGGER
jgi:hypothetical protein